MPRMTQDDLVVELWESLHNRGDVDARRCKREQMFVDRIRAQFT